MGQSRFSPRLIAGIIVALFFGVALYLRIAIPYDHVFVGDWIKFAGNDAYRHMFYVDNLVHNFPHLSSFNPCGIYPRGSEVGGFLFFDYLLAGIIWLIGLGSPTQHTIDVVGVYFPAVLGALTVIPVYFIGKALFNRWAGVLSAGLVAILPGEFLGRSLLGFTDYHVAETLFSTTAMLFLILAVKGARRRGLTFNHLRHRDWGVVRRPLVYSLVAGVFLGIYLLTWTGALLFVFIIFVYFIIQSIVDHLRGVSTDYLCLVGFVAFFVALIMFVPMFHQQIYVASLVIALFTPVVLSAVSRVMANWKLKPVYYPLTLIGFGLAGLAVFYAINPSLLGSMLGKFSVLMRAGPWRTILEAQPILFPGGEFSFEVVWGYFTTGFFLSFISLGILIYFLIKRGEADKTLFIVWSLTILAATLSMRRFAYYFAVNVALLTGYFSWLILEFAGFRESVAEPLQISQEGKKTKKKSRKTGSRLTASRANMALGVIVVFGLVFYPNLGPLPGGARPAIDVASHPQFAPSDAWCESLSWVKDNTPEPFGEPGFYYELHEAPPAGEKYSYPETAYGVAAWWDYGYWITRMAHRIPNANPGQAGAPAVARLFIAQDEASASEIADALESKYVIIDCATATTKFHALATWAASSKEEFYDLYYREQGDRLVPVTLFYPDYYRSLAVRLYNFDGIEVIPQDSMVISYEERISPHGEQYKEITGVESFSSYEEAEAYVAGQESGNHRTVGTNPFVSPLPLEGLEQYNLIYSSDSSVIQPDVGSISEVKIFGWELLRVNTGEAENVADTSARLIGYVRDFGRAEEAAVSFVYGTTQACEYGETMPELMDSVGYFEHSLTGLLPNTTYYWRGKAVGDGDSLGRVKAFTTTGLAPTLTTLKAIDVADTSARLSGELTHLGRAEEAAVSFVYGTTQACEYGETIPELMSSAGCFDYSLTDLSPNTTYYWRAKGVGDGTSYGWVKAFTTTGPAPIVNTLKASDVADTSARLSGELTHLGGAEETAVSFVHGTTEDCEYGETIPEVVDSRGGFDFTLSGLSPNITYYYRAKAVGNGMSYGWVQSFTTSNTDVLSK